MAASGKINTALLKELNELHYYRLPYPKSLANDFGTDVIYPHIQQAGLSVEDGLATFVEHIAFQISLSVADLKHLATSWRVPGRAGPRWVAVLTPGVHFLLHKASPQVNALGVG